MPESPSQSLIEVARQRAADGAARTAFTFVKGDGGKEESLTLGELDEQARAVAATLQAEGLQGERVLLLFPPGLDYIVGFWGCVYAGAIAVPAYPPDPRRLDRTLPRLAAILRDATAAGVLTTAPIRWIAQPLLSARLGVSGLKWVTHRSARPAAQWRDPGAGRDSLALLQYTSGSTGDPRGVMVSHGNLLENTCMVARAMRIGTDLRGFLWLPPYHDMGLVGGVVQPVVSGFEVTLMSPLDFISRPLRWLERISSRRLVASGGPNFAYDMCAQRIPDAAKETLDLSCWELAFSGAEPVRPSTLRRFAEAFAPCGFRKEAFYPCYGMAEATVFVTGGQPSTPPVTRAFDRGALGRGRVQPAGSSPEVELAGVGAPAEGLDVRILDPASDAPAGPGRIGEIAVAGPSVARGYWGREEESRRVFGTRLAGAAAPFLRTGDLGFFADGELYIAGRIKDLVIVGGVNYYPQDVELAVDRAHRAIRPGCAAAFAVERNGREALAVVAEVRTEDRTELDEAAAAVRRAVGGDLGIVPEVIAFLPRRTLLKTSSGKLQRNATRAGFLDGSLRRLAVYETSSPPAPAPEETLGSRIGREELRRLEPAMRAAVLHELAVETIMAIKPAPERNANPDDHVAELGLSSLDTVELLAAMEERIGVVLPMERLVRGLTLRELVAVILEELDRKEPESRELPALPANAPR